MQCWFNLPWKLGKRYQQGSQVHWWLLLFNDRTNKTSGASSPPPLSANQVVLKMREAFVRRSAGTRRLRGTAEGCGRTNWGWVTRPVSHSVTHNVPRRFPLIHVFVKPNSLFFLSVVVICSFLKPQPCPASTENRWNLSCAATTLNSHPQTTPDSFYVVLTS